MDITVLVVDDQQANFQEVQTTIATMAPIVFDGEPIKPVLRTITALRRPDGTVDVESVMNEASRSVPGVAIVDMRLEGEDPADYSGLDVAMRLKARYSDCCIILRSAYFAETPDSELFRHLELIRYAVDSVLTRDMERYLRDALLSHASSLFYRRRRFQQTVNGGWPDMWGLVIGRSRPGVRLDQHIPLPQLRSDSVVVEAIEIGVCGTNRASLGLMAARGFDLIDFHEVFGRVVWTGERVRDVRIGDYVVPMVRRCTPWDEPAPNASVVDSLVGVQPCDHKNHDCYKRPDQCPIGEYTGPSASGSRIGSKSLGTGKCHGFGSQYFVDTEDWLIRIDPTKTSDSVRARMMSRYVLTEPLSIVWKARREILKHYRIREYDDRVLIVGLGPIGLLAALVMKKMHPGLRVTAVDLANPDNPRAQAARALGVVEYHQAEGRGEAPRALHGREFEVIIEATDDPDRIMKYATELLAPGGIIVLLGVSEELGAVDLMSKTVTRFVKRNNILIGSINSARSDFLESVAFMENIVGDEESLLERMVSRWEITPDIGAALKEFGEEPRQTRNDIKVVLRAKDYSVQRMAAE